MNVLGDDIRAQHRVTAFRINTVAGHRGVNEAHGDVAVQAKLAAAADSRTLDDQPITDCPILAASNA